MEHLWVTVLLLLLPIHGSGKKAMAQNRSWMHPRRWYRPQADISAWWWEMLLITPCRVEIRLSCWSWGECAHWRLSRKIREWTFAAVVEGGVPLILEPSCPRGQAGMSLGCLARRCPSEVRLFRHLILMPLAHTSHELPQASLCFLSLRKWLTQINAESKTDGKC